MLIREIKYLIIITLLLFVSFPPFYFGFLTPVAISLFLLLIKDASQKSCFKLGYLFGLFFGAVVLYWIAANSLFGAILIISINALHYALVWWIYAIFRKRSEIYALFSLPIVWVAFEYLRLFGDLRFNWLSLAYTQTYYLPMIQIIEFTGYLFISFLIILGGVIIYSLFRFNTLKKWVIFSSYIFLILILNLYGSLRISKLETKILPMIKTAVIQPNINPTKKWDPANSKIIFNFMINKTIEIADSNLDLLVWPETAIPYFLRDKLEDINCIQNLVDSLQFNLLTGTLDYQYESNKYKYYKYNSAFFFTSRKRSLGVYNKIALVPGFEMLPFIRYFTLFKNSQLDSKDYRPGENFSIFKFWINSRAGRFVENKYHLLNNGYEIQNEVKLSCVICYESVFPHIVRKFVAKGANLLTIISNDGWFGQTSGPYQHLQYAIFRAIENRKSIIRCANTGVSVFISPTGRKIESIPLNSQKSIQTFIPLNSQKTFYTKNGEWFGKITLYVSLLLFIFKFTELNLFQKRIVGKRCE